MVVVKEMKVTFINKSAWRKRQFFKFMHVLHEHPGPSKSEMWAESMMVHIYDQMVYKLYGLTAEEIAIVEESVRR